MEEPKTKNELTRFLIKVKAPRTLVEQVADKESLDSESVQVIWNEWKAVNFDEYKYFVKDPKKYVSNQRRI